MSGISNKWTLLDCGENGIKEKVKRERGEELSREENVLKSLKKGDISLQGGKQGVYKDWK